MSGEPQLPIREELRRLSLRAVVAYAARCARRVQPLYPTAHREGYEAIERAILVAEQFARGILLEGSYADAVEAADAAYIHAAAGAADIAAEAAACAAADAARAAAQVSAVCAARAAADADAARAAAQVSAVCAAHAADAAHAAYAVRAAARAAARADFACLVELSTEPSPALGEPIDFDALGPLWPEGEPEWFKRLPETVSEKMPPQDTGAGDTLMASLVLREEERRFGFMSWRRGFFPRRPALEIYIDPGNASKETIQDVLERLSDLHRAAGGLGLTFEIDGLFVLATEEVLA